MSIICIANSKGGTGKTSISLNLIYHVKPDFVIDADIHRGITNLLALSDESIEVRHPKSPEDILEWTKTDKTVLIDCGGFDSKIVRYAISQADYIITPTTDDPTDQYALINFNESMKEISKMIDEHLVATIVLNRVHHSRTDFSGIDKLISELSHLKRSEIIIPQSVLIPRAAFKGCAVKSGSVANKFKTLSNKLK